MLVEELGCTTGRRIHPDEPLKENRVAGTRVPSNGVSLPALPGERYVCHECAFSYPDTNVEHALATIESVVQQLVSAGHMLRARRDARLSRDTWSVVEYLCHVRDVLMTSTMRLHRIAVEPLPTLEPMYNDVRAMRFRYAAADVDATLHDLVRAGVGLAEEVKGTDADVWSRLGRRWPGEERTALWIVRHAAHEVHHHAHDIYQRAGSPGEG